MQKAIIFTPDDNIESVDYKDWHTINEAVGGTFQTCGNISFGHPEKSFEEALQLTMFCNDEFLVRDDKEFEKVNAIATLLSDEEIRGNIILVADVETPDGIASRGFEYAEANGEQLLCEHMLVFDAFEQFIANHKEEIQNIHKALDMNKSEPMAMIISAEDIEKY